MKARRAGLWVAAALVVTCGVCIGLRSHFRRADLLAHGDSLWRISYRARFQATRAGAKLHLSIPSDTAHARLFHEDLLYSGLSRERLRSTRPLGREISLAARSRGPHNLTMRFDVHVSPNARWHAPEPAVPLTAEARDEFLSGTATLPVHHPIVLEVLTRLQPNPAAKTNLLRSISSFCARELRADEGHAPQDVPSVLRRRSASPLERAQAMVTLCRAAELPARLVAGFRLEETRDLRLGFWVELLVDNHWQACDPAGGFIGALPHNLVPVRRDGSEILRGSDLAELEASYSIMPLPPGPGAWRIGHGRVWAMFDLTRLPLEMHEVLSLILLLPLGALVTAFFRTVVGIRTFGTFTPTLLALSFVYADWRTGLAMLVVVLILGLASRSALDRLKLLMVPRLSVMLTLVVAWITFTVSVLDYYNLTPSAQAVILPMVILTMTIERFYLTSEEDTVGFALQLLGGTVLVGACCYGVLRWSAVGDLLLTYPEVHFFTLALLVLLGRYSGYRLMELWRFRDLEIPPH